MFCKEIDAKLCPKRDGIPSPACRNQMAEPSPGTISRNRRFSRFFVVFLPAVAGKCWKPSPKPMALLIPASKFILSENTVISLKNRTKADLRQRDLSTGVTVAHGSFFSYCGYTSKERTNSRQGGCRAINATMQFCMHLQCCNLHQKIVIGDRSYLSTAEPGMRFSLTSAGGACEGSALNTHPVLFSIRE